MKKKTYVCEEMYVYSENLLKKFPLILIESTRREKINLKNLLLKFCKNVTVSNKNKVITPFLYASGKFRSASITLIVYMLIQKHDY